MSRSVARVKNSVMTQAQDLAEGPLKDLFTNSLRDFESHKTASDRDKAHLVISAVAKLPVFARWAEGIPDVKPPVEHAADALAECLLAALSVREIATNKRPDDASPLDLRTATAALDFAAAKFVVIKGISNAAVKWLEDMGPTAVHLRSSEVRGRFIRSAMDEIGLNRKNRDQFDRIGTAIAAGARFLAVEEAAKHIGKATPDTAELAAAAILAEQGVLEAALPTLLPDLGKTTL